MKLNWELYPNFSFDELKCTATGECYMRNEMMQVLQSIRYDYDKPMFISSGYRSVKHPVEQEKDKPGEHTMGMAVDVVCYGVQALHLLKIAQEHGIRRIGIHQKGDRVSSRFLHFGIADKFYLGFPPGIWTY